MQRPEPNLRQVRRAVCPIVQRSRRKQRRSVPSRCPWQTTSIHPVLNHLPPKLQLLNRFPSSQPLSSQPLSNQPLSNPRRLPRTVRGRRTHRGPYQWNGRRRPEIDPSRAVNRQAAIGRSRSLRNRRPSARKKYRSSNKSRRTNRRKKSLKALSARSPPG